MNEPRVEVYVDLQGFWRFRLRGGNGEIMASSEPYPSRSNAVRGAEDFKRVAAEATIETS